jgi:hypothetical protein
MRLMEDDFSVQRYKAGLLSNIREALNILDQNEIHTDILDPIRSNAIHYMDKLSFDADNKINEMRMLEIQSLAENIISKTYQYWMYKEKKKIRYILAEDTKRNWNRIKQPAGQATKIKPDIFADRYSQNWEVEPAKIKIDKCSDFIVQRKLGLTENEMLKDLLNKVMMKDAISKRGIYRHRVLTN